MISLIICSRFPENLATVKENIAATIGVPHEIIAIDNSQGQYGICQAYNLGASQAQYSLLCFLHEDLLIRTTDWGQVVVSALADPSIGVLGVAGTTLLLNAPAAWWWSGNAYSRMQIQHSLPGKPGSLDYHNPQNELLADVVVADGVWLCSRKEVWQQFPFDEKNFREFHFYDLDYCVRIFSQLRVCITFDIVIEHFSLGSINEAWLRNALIFHRCWQKQLPISIAPVAKKENNKLERRALGQFLHFLERVPFSTSTRLNYLQQMIANRPAAHLTYSSRWLVSKLLPKSLKT